MREKKPLDDLTEYVRATYDEHYSHDGIQAIDLIIASGRGIDFCLGNIIKYATRIGHKPGEDRKQTALKIAHYSLLLLDSLENEHGQR